MKVGKAWETKFYEIIFQALKEINHNILKGLVAYLFSDNNPQGNLDTFMNLISKEINSNTKL